MVKIRLTQRGTKNRKTYRIVVMEARDRREGKAIEVLGYYNPLVKPAALSVERNRVEYWVSMGAQISPSVTKLLAVK